MTILAIIGAILVISTAWSAISALPKPLGDQLEYLGKEDYGNIFGFDSKPASIYYYDTELNVDQTVSYFKKADLLQTPFLENGKTTINIETPSGETIYIYHYPAKESNNFKTTKQYIVEIPSFKYQAALDSL